MASIPLPALAVQPPQQQPGPLQQFAAVQQIKAGQQDQQLRQLQIAQAQQDLKDQQAYAAAFKQWDPSKPDELPGLIAKNGGSGKAVGGAYAQSWQFKKDAATAYKDQQQGNSAAFDAMNKQADLLAGHIDTLKQLPDDKLPGAILPTVQTAIEQGLIPRAQAPQALQQAQQISQLAPAQIRPALDAMEKQAQGRKAILEQTAQQATIAKEQAATALSQAQIPGAQAESVTKQAEAAVAPQTAKRGIQQQRSEIAKNQAQNGEAAANTVYKKLETQYLQNAPPGLQGVRPDLQRAAAADYAKTSEEYASAHQAAQSLSDFINAAKSGNKEAVKIVPLQGALEITTAQGVHRINRTEVDQLAGAGSLYDKVAGKINGAISGKSITDSVLNDMQTLEQTIDKNATTLHSNKVKVINTTYGAHFEPMDFSGAQGGGNNSPSAPASDPFAQFGGKAR